MTPGQVADLQKKLRKAWSAATSSDPDIWSPENPAWGQCAVTACAVQDIFGGDIVWSEAALPDGRKISHYFNRINNLEIDFTRDQFPDGTQIPAGQPKTKGHPSTRDYVLSFPATQNRYVELKHVLKKIT